MKMARIRRMIGGAGFCLAIMAFGLGCEETTSTDNSIIVTPASTTVTGKYQSVVLVASAPTNRVLYLPLEWSVSTPSAGTVVGHGAFTAIYQSTDSTGNNVILVRDQGDSEGVAVVSQM